MPDNPPMRKRRVSGTIRRDRLKTEYLERIADSLERLVIASDSIATVLSLQTFQNQYPLTAERLRELNARSTDK